MPRAENFKRPSNVGKQKKIKVDNKGMSFGKQSNEVEANNRSARRAAKKKK